MTPHPTIDVSRAPLDAIAGLRDDCASDLASDTILFSDAVTTSHEAPGVTLRPLTDADRASVFRHTVEPIGNWGLESDHEVVATGGVFFHYNPPYGDVCNGGRRAVPAQRARDLSGSGVEADLP